MRHRGGLLLVVMLGCLGLPPPIFADSKSDCIQATAVLPSNAYRVQATSLIRKNLKPHFFGFNIVWVGFQEDWVSAKTGEVAPAVVEAMSAFPGAVYRYPGGTVSNYFDWRSTIGSVESRTAQKAVDWKGSESVRFGFHEYLQFVRRVGGEPWLVANLFGTYDREGTLEPLIDSARGWAESARKINAGILRWELGNELDRDRFQWPPDKYASRANAIAQAIRQADPEARFVSLLEDYDAQKWISASEYNTQVAASLSSLTHEYALHLYYDGKPGGPPMPHRYRHVCDSVRAAENGHGRSAKLWITEHARWPPGFDTPAWKENWPKTQDLSGALAVADMVIAASQSPAVEGLFLHSLSGSHGPWPLFHQTKAGLKPSLVYWALRVLRDSMLDQALQTVTFSKNASGYLGGYDIRASVLTNKDQSQFTLWAVNRAPVATNVHLKLPQLSGKSITAEMNVLADIDLNVSNVDHINQVVPISRVVSLVFDNQGVANILLPAFSVSAVALKPR